MDLYQKISTMYKHSSKAPHVGPFLQKCSKALQDSTTSPKTPLNHLQSYPAFSKLFLSCSPTSKAKWAHNLLEYERRKQREQRRKVEHNTQGMHTMQRVIRSSPYAFIYMVRLGIALTTHMGQCHHCNQTLSSNNE